MQYLSKSMEKTFLRLKSKATARHAYLEAEVVTGLAHQIRALRLQREWSQVGLAKRLGTTQAVISRLEDPSYGRYTLKTLIDLAKVFDTGMHVRFTSFISMLQETHRPNVESREVLTFEEEAPSVEFFQASPKHISSNYLSTPILGRASGNFYLDFSVQSQPASQYVPVELPPLPVTTAIL